MQEYIFLLCAILVLTSASPKPYFQQHYQYQEQSESYKNNELQHKKEEAGKFSKFGDGISDPVERSAFHKSEYHAPEAETGGLTVDATRNNQGYKSRNFGANNQGLSTYGVGNGHSQSLTSESDYFQAANDGQTKRILLPTIVRPNADHLVSVQEPGKSSSYKKEWSSHSSYSYGQTAQNPTVTHDSYVRPYHYGDAQTSGSTVSQTNSQEEQNRRYANFDTGSKQNRRYETQKTENYRPYGTLNTGDNYFNTNTGSQSGLTGINSPANFGTHSADTTSKVTHQRAKTYLITSTNKHEIAPNTQNIRVVPSTSYDYSTDTTQKISGVPIISFPNTEKQTVPNTYDYNAPIAPVNTNSDTSRTFRVSQNKLFEAESGSRRIQHPVHPGYVRIVPSSTTEQPLTYLKQEPVENKYEPLQSYPAVRAAPITTNSETTRTFHASQTVEVGSGSRRVPVPASSEPIKTYPGYVRINPRSTTEQPAPDLEQEPEQQITHDSQPLQSYPAIRTAPIIRVHRKPVVQTTNEQTSSSYQSSYSKTQDINQNSQQKPTDSTEDDYEDLTQKTENQFGDLKVESQKLDATENQNEQRFDDLTQHTQTDEFPKNKPTKYEQRTYRAHRTEKTEFADISQEKTTPTPQISFQSNPQTLDQNLVPQQRQKYFEVNHQTIRDYTQQKQEQFDQQTNIPEQRDNLRILKVEPFQNNPQTTPKPQVSRILTVEPFQNNNPQRQKYHQTSQNNYQSVRDYTQQTQELDQHIPERRDHLRTVPITQNGAQDSSYKTSSTYTKSSFYSAQNQHQPQVVFSPVQVGTKSGELQLYQTMQIPAGTSETTRRELQEQMRRQLEQKMLELQSQQQYSSSSHVTFSPIRVNSNSGTGEYQVYQTVQLPAGSTEEARHRIQEQMRQQLQQKLQELMQKNSQSGLVKSFGGADCDEQTGGSYSSSYSSSSGNHYESLPGSSYTAHYPGYHNY